MKFSGGQPVGDSRTSEGKHSPRATGPSALAGTMMLPYGFLGVVQGFLGLWIGTISTQVGNRAYSLDITGWSWIQIALGIVVAIVGCGILYRKSWTTLGIFITALAVGGDVLWLTYQPFLAVVYISIGIIIICALGIDHSRRRHHSV